MKKLVLLTLSLLSVANTSMAGHISVYTDATASTCDFAPGFNPNVHIIEQITTGSTGVRFKMDPGGSGFFGFNTPFVPVGSLTTDLSLAYGQCLNGSIILGTAIMSLVGGTTLRILPADGFAFILYTDCIFAELPGSGGVACVQPQPSCICSIAVESSTWGKVKSLYH